MEYTKQTPTDHLYEVAITYVEAIKLSPDRSFRDEEVECFIQGANFILNQFEHWARGIWNTQGGPNPSDKYYYGFQVARDILENRIPTFRKQ